MEDAQKDITDKLDKELNRYIAQYAALFVLNEELELLLRSDSLKAPAVESPTVVSWLTRLQELVQDAMQQPHGPGSAAGTDSPTLGPREGEEFRLSAGALGAKSDIP